MGVGAGWMEEEFDAIGVPYESRGRRLDESIELMRQCWAGAPGPRETGMFPIPEGILTRPFDIEWVERKSAQFRAELERERPGFAPSLLLRVGGDFGQLVQSMPGLAPRLFEAGVTDVVIDVDWSVEDGDRRTLEMARDVGF